MFAKFEDYSLIVVFSIVSIFSTSVYAGDIDLAKGGRIYDNWWVELNLDAPKETHPAYPGSGKKSGATTWRCKECHGWDYMGSKGAYAKGSHFTGFKGINHFNNKSMNDIVTVLHDNTHQFQSVLPKRYLFLVAAFVQKGQIDVEKIIDLKSKVVNGDPIKGKQTFIDYCKTCHGENGKDINLSPDKTKKVYVGGISNKNPWEILHKIRNGHPGATFDSNMPATGKMMGHMKNKMGMHHETMPAMLEKISLNEQANLLSYLMKLPVK